MLTNLTPTSRAQQAVNNGELSKSIVQEDFKDCFDKIGRFPGDKYHIQLVDNPNPVIHPPRTVPVHILPLYKAELNKMMWETQERCPHFHHFTIHRFLFPQSKINTPLLKSTLLQKRNPTPPKAKKKLLLSG